VFQQFDELGNKSPVYVKPETIPKLIEGMGRFYPYAAVNLWLF